MCTNILDKIFSSHRLLNAWDDIDFGNDGNFGIYGSTPTDMMHAFEEGIIPYILQILLEPMPLSMQSDIDLYMECILSKSNLQLSERSYFPHVNFTRGFTRMTQLTAAKKLVH